MSKIISITPTGQWQDLFKLEVSFDNGANAFGGGGGYNQSAPSFAPKTDDRSASIIRQVALKSAVEYACAAQHDVNTILANAETFNAWMTGASAAPASHTEHFANRNDPF